MNICTYKICFPECVLKPSIDRICQLFRPSFNYSSSSSCIFFMLQVSTLSFLFPLLIFTVLSSTLLFLNTFFSLLLLFSLFLLSQLLLQYPTQNRVAPPLSLPPFRILQYQRKFTRNVSANLEKFSWTVRVIITNIFLLHSFFLVSCLLSFISLFLFLLINLPSSAIYHYHYHYHYHYCISIDC